ncbi:fimbrial protein, partial [Klebsiella aerogenes]
GKIHFTGSLVNSACGLAPESSPVQVNFGEIPTSQLKDNQRAGVKH